MRSVAAQFRALNEKYAGMFIGIEAPYFNANL